MLCTVPLVEAVVGKTWSVSENSSGRNEVKEGVLSQDVISLVTIKAENVGQGIFTFEKRVKKGVERGHVSLPVLRIVEDVLEKHVGKVWYVVEDNLIVSKLMVKVLL